MPGVRENGSAQAGGSLFRDGVSRMRGENGEKGLIPRAQCAVLALIIDKPGLMPERLSSRGANVVITRGLGYRA